MADKVNVGSFAGSYASVEALNESLQTIETTFNDKVLFRDNPEGEENSMSNDLDMGGNDILNVGELKIDSLDGSVLFGDINVDSVTADTITGTTINGSNVVVPSPTNANQAANKQYVDSEDANTLELAKEYTNDRYNDPLIFDTPASVLQVARQYGDGVTTSFLSPSTLLDRTTNFLVCIDGVTQRPTTDFTIASNGKVVFAEAPDVNAIIDISYFNANLLQIEGTDGVIPSYAPRVLGDGVTTSFPTGAGTEIPNELFSITIDGITQRGIYDFVSDALGNVVFTVAPPNDSVIDIKWFQPNLVEQVSAVNSVLLVEKEITSNLIITDPYNGLSVSPTIADGVTVTVATGSTYVVL